MNEATDKIEEEDISLSDELSSAELDAEIPKMEEESTKLDEDPFEMKDDFPEKNFLQDEEKISASEEESDVSVPELSPKEHSVEIKEVPKKESVVEVSENELPNAVVKSVGSVAAAIPARVVTSIAATAQITDPNSLEVELTFVLGQQQLSIEKFSLLAEEKIITLGGSDFQVKIMLQETTVAEAQLVLVDGVPSLQITKIM
jgi:flagellar motor switch/type III secretory pathway protein FliN